MEEERTPSAASASSDSPFLREVLQRAMAAADDTYTSASGVEHSDRDMQNLAPDDDELQTIRYNSDFESRKHSRTSIPYKVSAEGGAVEQSGIPNISVEISALGKEDEDAGDLDVKNDEEIKPTTPSKTEQQISGASEGTEGGEREKENEEGELKKSPTATKSSVVTIVDPKDSTPPPPPKKRPTSSRLRMEKELARMAEAENNARLRQKAKRKQEVKKAVAEMYERKRADGVTLTQDVEQSRAAIRKHVREEEKMLLAKDQKVLREENARIQALIDDKYGLKDKKQGPDLLTLTEKFHRGNVKDDGLPDNVRRELTRSEVKDLKMVFDMFDMKGRGYITANDVKRAAGMLGFKAKKEIFNDMIEEVTGDKRGQVTFIHFLQFVVRGQGQGDDPLEDILQCFRLLDDGQKGYVTAEDLRKVADNQKLPLSNRAIREMIQEADMKGDAKITSDEFIRIMLQTSMFGAAR